MTQTGDSSTSAALSFVVDCFDSIIGKIPTCASEYPDDREKLSSNRMRTELITGEKMSRPVAMDITSAYLILSSSGSESFSRFSNEFKIAATAITDRRMGINVQSPMDNSVWKCECSYNDALYRHDVGSSSRR
mmetsp:Transcript_12000/g.18407  ORF Transcript_12000/g.18407 Transcript_12000/m.18407 type:complete len:133 (-) Transcript_12000:700-1098(-)